jgi:hypothetical protein
MGGCRCGVAAMEVSDVKGEGFFNVYIYIYRERERERERGRKRFLPFESRTRLLPFSLSFPLNTKTFSINFHFQVELNTRNVKNAFQKTFYIKTVLINYLCLDFRHGDAILVISLLVKRNV